MKLLHIIFLSVGSLLFMSIMGFLLYFKSFTEFSAVANINAAYIQSFNVRNVSELKIMKGNWEIFIGKGDTCSVSVWAGDNLLENYCSVSSCTKELILDVKDDFKYFNNAYLKAVLNLPELKKIEIHGNSKCTITNYVTKNIKLLIADYAELQIHSSEINKLNLIMNDYGYFSSQNNNIKEFQYLLDGASYAKIDTSIKNISGVLKGNSLLESSETLLKSDSLNEYKGNVLKFMPNLVFYETEESLDEMMYNDFSAVRDTHPIQQNFIEDPYLSFNLTNRLRAFSYLQGRIFNKEVENWILLASNGIINNIRIVFKEKSNLIWAQIKDSISENYGKILTKDYFENNQNVSETVGWENFLVELNCWLNIHLSKNYKNEIIINVSLMPDIVSEPKYILNGMINRYQSTVSSDVVVDRIWKRVFDESSISILPDFTRIK